MTISAIETQYAGCRFRSRLEARWAVFFDRLGIRWEYEPQGYNTPAGPYLPDFLLHLRRPTLFEVKPESDLGKEDGRWWGASEGARAPLVVAYGMPRPNELCPSSQPGNGLLNMYDASNGFASWDNFYAFCTCPGCGAVGVEFDGRGGRVCGYGVCTSDDKAYSYDNDRIADAYLAARGARFEHGECG